MKFITVSTVTKTICVAIVLLAIYQSMVYVKQVSIVMLKTAKCAPKPIIVQNVLMDMLLLPQCMEMEPPNISVHLLAMFLSAMSANQQVYA